MPHTPRILASWLIGSHASCDLVVNHPTVSGQHCRLTKYPTEFTLEDLGSTNGTYVDGGRIPPRQPIAVRRQHPDLAQEACGEVLTTHQVRQQHLHGLDAIREDIPHAKHPPHPPAAELVQNFVIADAFVRFHIGLPDQGRVW